MVERDRGHNGRTGRKGNALARTFGIVWSMIRHMRLYQQLLLSLLLLGCAKTLSAQIEVNGTVVDEANQPLPYVVVSSLKNNVNAYTDERGTFELLLDKPDSLTFHFVGFLDKSVYVRSDTTLLVSLDPDINPSTFWVRANSHTSLGIVSGLRHTPYGVSIEGGYSNPLFQSPLVNLGFTHMTDFDGNNVNQVAVGINRLFRLFNKRWEFKIERRNRNISEAQFNQHIESWIFTQNENLFGLTFFPGVGVLSEKHRPGAPNYFLTKLGVAIPIIRDWNAYAEALVWNGQVEFSWFMRVFLGSIEFTGGSRHFQDYNEINLGLSYLIFKNNR